MLWSHIFKSDVTKNESIFYLCPVTLLVIRYKKGRKQAVYWLANQSWNSCCFPCMRESASLYFPVNKAEHFETHFSSHPTCKLNTSSVHTLHCDSATGASRTKRSCDVEHWNTVLMCYWVPGISQCEWTCIVENVNPLPTAVAVRWLQDRKENNTSSNSTLSEQAYS